PPVRPPLTTMQPQLAVQACRAVEDDTKHAHCVFDVTVTGDAEFARGYLPADGTAGGAAQPAGKN
ncbi:MAG TPA: hypothetical protein VN153_08015, partial [Tahibacter sp.]|nr:hypothetical protein [Tahibacter sp.]